MTAAQGRCEECFPVLVSSQACPSCGRRGVMSRERIDRTLLDYTWEHYAVGRAMEFLDPPQGSPVDATTAYLWLRTTLRHDHPNYVDPKDLGYGIT